MAYNASKHGYDFASLLNAKLKGLHPITKLCQISFVAFIEIELFTLSNEIRESERHLSVCAGLNTEVGLCPVPQGLQVNISTTSGSAGKSSYIILTYVFLSKLPLAKF